LVFVLLILGTFPLVLLSALFPKKWKDRFLFAILKIISNIWLISTFMLPKNYHRNKVDFSKSYLLMPNHQSFLDAAMLYTSLVKPFKTLGKKEVEKAPIYGIVYKMVVITVDRSSVTAKAKSFRQMKKEMEDGLSVGIFPEGTFADQPQAELLPFQNGGFALALMQQADMLPLLFLDTPKRMHPSSITRMTPGWNRTVFLPPVAWDRFDKKDSEGLKNFMQRYMQDCLDFCRSKGPEGCWDFAQNWLKTNDVR
jgi:1-acyl-sn-glycerol-3-phosphate acyltransferase